MNGFVRRCAAPVLGTVVALTVAAGGLQAQAEFGVQASYGDDSELGIGGRVGLGLEDVDLRLIGSGEIFFPGDNVDWIDLNANLVYDVPLEEDVSILPYVGTGLNLALISLDDDVPGSGDDSTEELGLNLLGGAQFPLENSPVTPFAEVRVVVISDVDQFVLTGGILFGGGS